MLVELSLSSMGVATGKDLAHIKKAINFSNSKKTRF
jgi:hypothetical protein